MTEGPVTQGNQTGAPQLQQSSWGNALQQSTANPDQTTSAGQVGVSGLQTRSNGAVITVSTTAVPTSSAQVQTETTPLTTADGFHLDGWMIFVGAAILAVVVVSFLVSTVKDRHSTL